MKYILKRDHYIKESFMNPDREDEKHIEWADTLIGGLVNRIYGSVKNKIKKGIINKLGDKLDAAVARIIVNSAKKEDENISNIETAIVLQNIDDILYEVENETIDIPYEEIKDTIDKVVLLLGEHDEISKILKEFKQYLLPAASENNNLIVNNEYTLIKNNNKITIIIDDITNDIVTAHYKDDVNNKITLKKDGIEIYQNTIKMLNDDSNTIDVEATEMPSEENLNKLKSLIVEYNKHRLDIAKRNSSQSDVIDFLSKLDNKLKTNISNFSKTDVDMLILAINYILDTYKKGEPILLKAKQLQLPDHINEARNVDRTRLSSFIDKVRVLIRERNKNYKFTNEEVENIDNKVKSNTTNIISKNIINGNDLREIVNIIEKARQQIVSNNYEDLRKKQKRYYIHLNGGMAIHKASHDAWSKRVQNISAYYKDILPKEFIEFLLDTLNYNTSELNGYVDLPRIIKKYLGFEVVLGTGKPYTTSTTHTHTTNNTGKTSLHFETTTKVIIHEYHPFIIKGNNYFTLLPIKIYTNDKLILFKKKTNDVKWLNTYCGEHIEIEKTLFNMNPNSNDKVSLYYMSYSGNDKYITKGDTNIFYELKQDDYKNGNFNNIEEHIININDLYALYNKNNTTQHRVTNTPNTNMFDAHNDISYDYNSTIKDVLIKIEEIKKSK